MENNNDQQQLEFPGTWAISQPDRVAVLMVGSGEKMTYLELDEKPKAQSAFEKAATMDHDLEVREDALFNQAKLAFETDFNPFNDAIAAFEQYLEEYPDSPRRDEAYGFLLDVYLTTRNHVRALDALDKIQRKSPKEKKETAEKDRPSRPVVQGMLVTSQLVGQFGLIDAMAQALTQTTVRKDSRDGCAANRTRPLVPNYSV